MGHTLYATRFLSAWPEFWVWLTCGSMERVFSLSLPEADEHFTGLETPDFGLCYQRSQLTAVGGAVAIRIAKTLYNGDLRGSAPTVGLQQVMLA